MQIFVFLQTVMSGENKPAWGGFKQKKLEKKQEMLAFKSLLREIRLRNLHIRKIFWSSNISFEIKKIAKLNYIHHPCDFIKNLWQIHLRESHMKFTGKNKVDKTMWNFDSMKNIGFNIFLFWLFPSWYW